jgi:predicted transcriptional regulator
MTDRAYFRFLALAEDPAKLMKVSRDALALLDVIASCADLEPLSVTEAMSLASIASPATIHRKLDELVEAGLVTHDYRDGNRRTKYLLPTKKAWAHYEFQSYAIREAAK